MRNLLGFTLALLLVSGHVLAQTPVVDLALTISDGAGGTKELRFGLDPTATNGIDAGLGESELPPFPPAGVFEARFIGDDIGIPELGQGSYKDYRTGDRSFRDTKTHGLRYQVGAGTSIVISWNLSNGATGILQDIITGNLINEIMRGTGSFTVTNPGAFNKLKVTINYSTTEVQESPLQLLQAFSLAQNYPNPFNPSTAIDFHVPVSSFVTVKVFDVLGKEVATLVNERKSPGAYRVNFNASGLADGVYFYRLQAGQFAQTRKLVLLR